MSEADAQKERQLAAEIANPDPQTASDATELASLTGIDYRKCLRTLIECEKDVQLAAEMLLGLNG